MNKVVKHFTHIYFLSSVLAFVGVLLFSYKTYAAIDAVNLQASNTVGVIENISRHISGRLTYLDIWDGRE